jgi:hypothetical protein
MLEMLERVLTRIISRRGTAGAIAIIITGSICYRYIADGDRNFPEILTYALSTILGVGRRA